VQAHRLKPVVIKSWGSALLQCLFQNLKAASLDRGGFFIWRTRWLTAYWPCQKHAFLESSRQPITEGMSYGLVARMAPPKAKARN
jgi:hypothetical protein